MFKLKTFLYAFLLLGVSATAKETTLNFIHIGDLHGHLTPRDHVTLRDALVLVDSWKRRVKE